MVLGLINLVAQCHKPGLGFFPFLCSVLCGGQLAYVLALFLLQDRCCTSRQDNAQLRGWSASSFVFFFFFNQWRKWFWKAPCISLVRIMDQSWFTLRLDWVDTWIQYRALPEGRKGWKALGSICTQCLSSPPGSPCLILGLGSGGVSLFISHDPFKEVKFQSSKSSPWLPCPFFPLSQGTFPPAPRGALPDFTSFTSS